MRIGIVCYPSVGGSGVVATELGKHLATRGHEIHFISSEVPFRLNEFHENITFHEVETPLYPLFKEPPYFITLTNKIAEVARMHKLDIVHAHYAIPHAASAYMARCILGPNSFKVVTTLHGTDITLMGQDPSFTESIAFSINQSDGVTAVSNDLRQATYEALPVTRDIQTIHNFLDCAVHHRVSIPWLKNRYTKPGEKVILHMSNFRAVKRVEDAVRAFALIAKDVPSRLMLLGDGPERAAVHRLVLKLGLERQVTFMGKQEQVIELLSLGDLFLLPSEQESFGLAALEAMACEVPVVAYNVGGLPEVVVEGSTGYLVPLGDVDAMAERSLRLLGNPDLQRELAIGARQRVKSTFCSDRIVPQYEAFYEAILNGYDVAQNWP